MLSPDDALLAKRDSAIPGLAVLLDPEAMAAEISRVRPDLSVPRLETSYLRYKPGTSCLASYRTPDGRPAVYATAYRVGSFDKLEKASFVIEDLAIAVHPFPHDRRLRSLQRVHDAASLADELHRILPERSDLEGARPRTLRYKPERRYVAALATGGNVPAAVLKLHAVSSWERARANAVARRSKGPLRTAPLLGESPRRRMLLYGWLEGDPLSPSAPNDRFEALGHLLAEFHSGEPRSLAIRSRDDEAKAISAAASAVAAVDPDSGRSARELARDLRRRFGDLSERRGVIHGDFSVEQVLVGPDGFALLDLDEAAAGDRSADLGSFFADLERLLPPEETARAGESFLRGYGTRPAGVGLYTSAALLRLAIEPFRRREPDWPEQTRRLLERARTILPPLQSRSRGAASPALDPAMPFLREALDPPTAERFLREALPVADRDVRIRAARLVRHKPGRRCLIEYELTNGSENRRILGKVRARGVDHETYRVTSHLAQVEFQTISVPQPLGIVPELRMWLQEKVPGRMATELLSAPSGAVLARRIAEGLAELHGAAVAPDRRHTVADELAILRERFARLANANPAWADRLERLIDACHALAEELPPASLRGIHRDFYPDHVLVDGDRLFFVDFDLYCQGDPALDAGNFVAHVTEQSLRMCGSAAALKGVGRAFTDRFVELSGAGSRARIEICEALSLARHVSLSWEIPGRRGFTGRLLELCEERLIESRSALRTGRR